MFGICWLVALLTPRTYVPPAWWQAGWRRPPVGSGKEVELLSQLAALLMPNTTVAEVFRSFPSLDGNSDLEPSLSVYGVLQDPRSALFVEYDCKGNGKMESKLRSALLAYGPPGSHILYISHTESRPLEDKVLCVKVRDWQTGDLASLSEVLANLYRQILLGFGQVLCLEVLQQLECLQDSFKSGTNEYIKIFLRGEAARHRFKRFLHATGFEQASIKYMQKCAILSGKCAEAKLQSRIHWLLNEDQRPLKVAKAVAVAGSSTLLGSLDHNINIARQWLLEFGVPPKHAAKATTMFPSILCRSVERGLVPFVQWLLNLGLSTRQVVRAIRCCPEVLGCSIDWKSENIHKLVDLVGLSKVQVVKVVAGCPEILSTDVSDTVQWFLDLGLTTGQLAKMISVHPRILFLEIEGTLKPNVQWLLDLGMTQKQVVKAVTASPQILGLSMEMNLKPKVQQLLKVGLQLKQVAKIIPLFPKMLTLNIERSLWPKVEWLLELGLTQVQVVKVITVYPQILGRNTELSLSAKVKWLLDIGLTQGQVAKVTAVNPQILGRSIQHNLEPKVGWLLELGLTQDQIAKAVVAFPQLFAFSIEQNLHRKVQWLRGFGLQDDQIVKIISFFPLIFKYSISTNLVHKQALLQRTFGTLGAAAEIVLKHPRILGSSYRRLSTRLEVLVARNETMKLSWVMQMTDEQFKTRFFGQSST